MASTSLTVEIDGTPLERREELEVQVEEATDEADAAMVSAPLRPTARGDWESVLDPLTTPRTPLSITIERGRSSYKFEGRSTEASWQFDAGGSSRLLVKAIDRTLDMNLEEKIVAWGGASDGGIAESILSDHNFRPNVASTPEGPDPDVHVVIQRATDWAFLRSLAAKYGYAVYLESAEGSIVGTFGPVDALAAAQLSLAFGVGGAATRARVQAQLVAGKDVRAARITPLSDSVVQSESGGRASAQATRSLGGETAVLLAPEDVDGEIDPNETAEGVARRSAFVLRLDADVDTARLDRIVRARRTVDVSGLGAALSGTWLVDRVRHRLTTTSHVQQVSLIRNAFGGTKGLLA